VRVLSGYDSELEAEANEDYIRDPKPQQVWQSSLNVTPLTCLPIRYIHCLGTRDQRQSSMHTSLAVAWLVPLQAPVESSPRP
jgi:hypothetical protein